MLCHPFNPLGRGQPSTGAEGSSEGSGRQMSRALSHTRNLRMLDLRSTQLHSLVVPQLPTVETSPSPHVTLLLLSTINGFFLKMATSPKKNPYPTLLTFAGTTQTLPQQTTAQATQHCQMADHKDKFYTCPLPKCNTERWRSCTAGVLL
jgi:hypothetical protein